MQSDELIYVLKEAQKRAGQPLPVIMLMQAGAGDIHAVRVEYDNVNQRHEIWLQERPA